MSNINKQQTLNGAVFTPAICPSWLTSGFTNPAALQGASRVFPRRNTGRKVLPFADGLILNTVITTPADLSRVRATVLKCAQAKVTLTLYHVTGTFAMKLVTPPAVAAVPATGVLAVTGTATWPASLPAQAKGVASLLNFTAVVVLKYGGTIVVSNSGNIPAAASQLAPAAVSRAQTATTS